MSSIFVGIGSNLASPRHGQPTMVAMAAVGKLNAKGIGVSQRSRWYRSVPVPVSAQPHFINGVARVTTELLPEALLQALHQIEEEFGRVRTKPNAARVLDLDLLAFGDLVIDSPNGLRLPHPRLHARAFVLKPLFEVEPTWRHPLTGQNLADLIAALPAEQIAEPVDEP